MRGWWPSDDEISTEQFRGRITLHSPYGPPELCPANLALPSFPLDIRPAQRLHGVDRLRIIYL